jgi:hypothetical protein
MSLSQLFSVSTDFVDCLENGASEHGSRPPCDAQSARKVGEATLAAGPPIYCERSELRTCRNLSISGFSPGPPVACALSPSSRQSLAARKRRSPLAAAVHSARISDCEDAARPRSTRGPRSQLLIAERTRYERATGGIDARLCCAHLAGPTASRWAAGAPLPRHVAVALDVE